MISIREHLIINFQFSLMEFFSQIETPGNTQQLHASIKRLIPKIIRFYFRQINMACDWSNTPRLKCSESLDESSFEEL